MKVWQMTSKFPGGGSGKMAWELHRGVIRNGFESKVWVDTLNGVEPGFEEFAQPSWQDRFDEHYGPTLANGVRSLTKISGLRGVESFRRFDNELGHFLRKPFFMLRERLGWDSLASRQVRRWAQNQAIFPDIIQGHTLEGGFFDLSVLPEWSRRTHIILTLHNGWYQTGLCHHWLDCDHWKSHCCHCPRLDMFPRIVGDPSTRNFYRKKNIYRRSRFRVVGPCNWIVEHARKSILKEGSEEFKVIYNGVDQSVFKPGDRMQARIELGLPAEGVLLLFVGNKTIDNKWKKFDWMRSAVEALPRSLVEKHKVKLVLLGQDGSGMDNPQNLFIFRPFERDPERIALFYQAADIFLHAALMDTFPTTVLEAMSSRLPVVATRVGGIPEQVTDGVDGFLHDNHSSDGLTRSLADLISSASLRSQMGQSALARAKKDFSVRVMVDKYLEWYQEIQSIPLTS